MPRSLSPPREGGRGPTAINSEVRPSLPPASRDPSTTCGPRAMLLDHFGGREAPTVALS